MPISDFGKLVMSKSIFSSFKVLRTCFTTSFNFDPDTTIVFINGVKQKKPLHYNTVGFNTVTFSDSPLVGDILEINYVKI